MLRFSPTAWAKLLYLRDYGDTEVGGFGLSASDDLLLIEDIRLVRQICSSTHVALEDESVADFFDAQVDAGRHPEQFGRIWLHTHPGDCPYPSQTDEATFDRVFGHTDWAIMFILACEGQSYARLRFNVGPRAEFEIAIGMDYLSPFVGSDVTAWKQEYENNVFERRQSAGMDCSALKSQIGPPFDEEPGDDWYESWFDYAEDEQSSKGFIT